MADLTPRQAQVLALIRDHINETGYPPTRADIARALGFRSANAAEEHLRALARKGVVEISSGTSRGIRVLQPDAEQLVEAGAEDDESGLPVIGRVAAGQPILAAAHVETRYPVDAATFRPRADYLLRVRGDSMRNAGILDGDLLAVHRQPRAEWGQIVVARLDDEVTVKRLARGRTTREICLLPENPDFEPIQVDLREQPAVIEGLAVGVLRTSI